MSREDDIETIMRFLPCPAGVNRGAVRRIFERFSEEGLRDMRTSVDRISSGGPKPTSEAALHTASNGDPLMSLFEEWAAHSPHARKVLGNLHRK